MVKDEGVTLVALVVTILVILILTGVVINTIFGHGSILENAKNTVEKYNEKVQEEQEILNSIIEYLTENMERYNTDAT